MRAGLSTIQQTLTPEAASVLTRSIAEAARRSHGQTTPLHVAATLLAAPCGFLRQACIRSHPQSSHPLQCRALELCFSVALDRLPASNPPAGTRAGGVAEPPISNALMAALKRAQANQRRGCPEQQQPPLLAVKVELEQLIISILDDPSVSRVMREASFSSVAIKTAVEQSLFSSPAAAASATSISALVTVTAAAASPPVSSRFLSLTNRASTCHNLYMNPRLHQLQANGGAAPAGSGGDDQPRTEEVERVLNILSRPRKRNPILVGDCNPDAVMREVLQRIQSGDVPPPLRDAQLLAFPKEIAAAGLSQIATKIRELGSSIDSAIGGVILDLRDLKWLVESISTSTSSGPSQLPKPIVSEAARVVVEEMGRLLKRFQGGDRLWLVGTATCATYLRCQVYHPAMENDWDLQAVPIAPRSSLINTFPRLGGNGILSSSVEKLAPMKSAGLGGTAAAPLKQPPATASAVDPPRRSALCPLCLEGYERELANLAGKELGKYSPKPETSPELPQWLQLAKPPLQSKEEMMQKYSDELLKKWTETCSKSHIASEMPWAPLPPNPLTVFKSLPGSISPPPPNSTRELIAASGPPSPPTSPVRTDLVLGRSKVSHSPADNKTHEVRLKDFTGCVPDACSDQYRPQVAAISDIDAFKRLFKGLSEKVCWQPEASSAIAAAVMRCNSGNGKQRAKGDAWVLLVGPDKVGKRKMASALSELMFGTGPTVVNFGSASYVDGNDGESNFSHRGRTCTDRIVEAVRRNPFSVIVLEEIDRADMLLQGKIKQAMQRGHLLDSYGREVSLGSVVFVLIADWLPEELRSYHSLLQYEEKMLDSAHREWELELSTGDRPGKRHHDWASDDDRPVKPRKESPGSAALSLDLNLALGADAEAGEGSRNSSDLSTEQDYDKGRLAVGRSPSSLTSELVELADEAITFKPVDFGALRKKVMEAASAKFVAVMGEGREMRLDEDALDRIVGGLWLGGEAFDEWAERVLVPSLKQLRGNLRANDDGLVIIRLSTVKGGQGGAARSREVEGWLPATVAVAIDGAIDS